MKLTEFSVKNYRFTLIMFLGALTVGLFALFTMPRGEDPETHAPSYLITVVYPGASPADMEEQVAEPIENKLHELKNITKLTSDNYDGLSVIYIEYTFGVDTDEKFQEVTRVVNSVRNDLPKELAALQISQWSPLDVSIYQIGLISETMSWADLKNKADKLKDKLEKVQSIRNIKIWGLPEQEVRVELNLEKMAHHHIPANAVIGALQSEAVNIPGGSIAISNRKFNVKTSGNMKSADEVANTVILANGPKVVLLKDIASVTLQYENQTHITRQNGKRAIFITLNQKEGQNILSVEDEIEPVLADFSASLPPSVKFEKIFVQSESVKERLLRLGTDFSIAILLVLLTLLPLGGRASAVVMISIPLSLAIGLTLLNLFGFTINQLSIVGMIIALGLLVDDSIVVVENIERFLRSGSTPFEAAIKATSQISSAVVGCTILLILSFMPLVFLPGGAGDFIRSLPVAVISTVFASMLVSLTVVPFLASKLLVKHENPEGNIFLRALKRGISGSYSKVLDRSLLHPKTTLLIAGLIFVGAMALIPIVGTSLFPKSEKPMFMVNIRTPVGTNISATDSVTRYVESVLNKEPLIKSFSSNVGKGNPQVYYNVLQDNEAENIAEIFIQLQPVDPAEKNEIIDRLREELKFYPNAKIEVKDFEQGPPVEAPVAYRIFGENLDTLRKVAADIETILKETEGMIYVNNPVNIQPTDLKVAINKEKAGLLGVASSDVDLAVRMGVAGLPIGFIRNEKGDEHQIIVSLPKQGRTPDLSVFDQLYIGTMAGNSIPLKQVADVRMETSPNQIRHYLKQRYVTVSAFVKPGFNVAEKNSEIISKLENYNWPPEFTYQVGGEQESRDESFGGIGTIVLLTIFGFIGVLILEFKTFKSILIVLSVVPLGMVGAILMLLIFGETFSFTATIGMIALVGLEIKNSLLLVDFTNQLRLQGRTIEEAIRESGEIRFVPILLTTVTAIGGLLPLVIEYNQLYSPLALVLIGGLISSTFLARLVTPVMYKLLPPEVSEG
ncbi:MAG: efflux RND transporter permease subunit [Bacteroidetes bacterium]|nr:efflux RND transporter permease subunit [Bacteroidota bacterium]